MFAGMNSLVCESGSTDIIISMQSKEAEDVPFMPKPVKISDNPSINGWLGKVEEAMATSLSMQLANLDCATNLRK